MAASLSLIPFLLHFVLFISLPLHRLEASSNPDSDPLLAFKASSDTSHKLSSWNVSSDICNWYGVSCIRSRVSRLVLEGLDLTGSFRPLTSLTQLRVLSLKHNLLSGPIPDLSNLTTLKLLFLSHNNFSGGFPASLSPLFRLYRLDLSHNNLSGQIPPGVNHLMHLLTLRLEENRFTGSISGLNLPNIQDFNVSGNHLSGAVPKSLWAFPKSAFDRNLVLCGGPLPDCSNVSSDPSRPGSPTGAGSTSPVNAGPTVVASSPSSKPDNEGSIRSLGQHRRRKINRLAVILIVLGDVLILALVSGLLFCYFWRNFRTKEARRSQILVGEKLVYSSSPYPPQGCFERGKMVFFEGMRRFELEDLLRASAEMLGKGGFGTAYKAVLDDGNVVAVKRLKDVQVGGRRDFEHQMEILGGLRHPNIVGLMAYYYSRDERLLVYEYMQNGSLFSLLHGNRGPGRTPLDWTTRMKIAAGAARALAFIHHGRRAPKLCHGNVKSANILIDKAGAARLSDYGFSAFASAALRPNGYRAPELSDGRKFSQKADVFAFGVVLLEILTGKCPSTAENGSGIIDLPRWVQSVVREEWTAEVFDIELMRYKDIEEEMVGMLQIAMASIAVAPDQRPRMSQVVKMIEDIRGEELSSSYESLDSVSESASLSEEIGVISL